MTLVRASRSSTRRASRSAAVTTGDSSLTPDHQPGTARELGWEDTSPALDSSFDQAVHEWFIDDTGGSEPPAPRCSGKTPEEKQWIGRSAAEDG